MHLGAGLALLCADPTVDHYGKILCIRERRHADTYTMPGGRRRDDDLDIYATAIRETAEETVDNQDDAGVVDGMIRRLRRYVKIDRELSHEIPIVNGTAGVVFGVVDWAGCLYPDCRRLLNRNDESAELVWMTVDEIRSLSESGKFRGKRRYFEQTIVRMARKNNVTLAGRTAVSALRSDDCSRLLALIHG